MGSGIRGFSLFGARFSGRGRGGDSVDRARLVGSLEPGKLMDAVIVDGSLVDLLRVGSPAIRRVIKRGRVVHP